jgi:hypothetical protein
VCSFKDQVCKINQFCVVMEGDLCVLDSSSLFVDGCWQWLLLAYCFLVVLI